MNMLKDEMASERVQKAEVVQVIKITLIRGTGTEDNPAIPYERYYSFNGKFLGESEK